MFARTVLACALLGAVSWPAFADWIAVAQSTNQSVPWLYASKGPDRNATMLDAVRRCGRQDCRIIIIERGGCVVVAAKKGDYRGGVDLHPVHAGHWQDASARALQACSRKWGTESCDLTTPFCTNDTPTQQRSDNRPVVSEVPTRPNSTPAVQWPTPPVPHLPGGTPKQIVTVPDVTPPFDAKPAPQTQKSVSQPPEPQRHESSLPTLQADLERFIQSFDFESLATYCLAGAFALFAGLSFAGLVKRGRHDIRVLATNATWSTLIGVTAFVGYAGSVFLFPHVANWLQSLSRPALILLIVVSASVIILFVPVSFGQKIRGIAKKPTKTKTSEAPASKERNEKPPPAEPQPHFEQDVAPETAAPATGMQLKIKRSERQSFTGKPIFVLDARMAVSAEIADKIRKYGLGDRVVYDSAARQRYQEAAAAHAENTRDSTSIFAPASEQWKGIGRTFWSIGRAQAWPRCPCA